MWFHHTVHWEHDWARWYRWLSWCSLCENTRTELNWRILLHRRTSIVLPWKRAKFLSISVRCSPRGILVQGQWKHNITVQCWGLSQFQHKRQLSWETSFGPRMNSDANILPWWRCKIVFHKMIWANMEAGRWARAQQSTNCNIVWERISVVVLQCQIWGDHWHLAEKD